MLVLYLLHPFCSVWVPWPCSDAARFEGGTLLSDASLGTLTEMPSNIFLGNSKSSHIDNEGKLWHSYREADLTLEARQLLVS